MHSRTLATIAVVLVTLTLATPAHSWFGTSTCWQRIEDWIRTVSVEAHPVECSLAIRSGYRTIRSDLCMIYLMTNKDDVEKFSAILASRIGTSCLSAVGQSDFLLGGCTSENEAQQGAAAACRRLYPNGI